MGRLLLVVWVGVSLAVGACGIQAQPASPSAPSLSVQVIASDLNTPWAMDFAPDGRIFIAERPGSIRIFKDTLELEPWLQLDVAAVGEGGLLGLALDPAFSSNGFVYVAYTVRTPDGSLQNRLLRLKEAYGRGMLDRVLAEGIPGNSNHDGGRVKFGPDGKLYWTVGDAQDAPVAQQLSSPNGKILRLEPDGSVPADNPFPGSLVYSYGHRNPEGLAWQPGTGRLYSTEHGPSARDEVNYIQPGSNYGWPVITGDERREGMVTPIVSSGSDTWAPAGATFISRGAWAGSLLFTGLRGQSVYRLVLDSSDPVRLAGFERYLTGEYGRLRDIVEAPDRSIYLLTSNRDGRGNPAPGDDKLLKLIVR